MKSQSKNSLSKKRQNGTTTTTTFHQFGSRKSANTKVKEKFLLRERGLNTNFQFLGPR